MRTIKLIAFPASGIAYMEEFYREVEALGVNVVDGVFSGRWISQNVGRGDIGHFHWPSFSYSTPGSYLSLLARFLRFLALLLLLRLRGARLAWTAHNLLPHDPSRLPILDVIGRHVIIALCERIAVHGIAAASVLEERFPGVRGKLVIIAHGHVADHYRNDITRSEARQRLGLPQNGKVVLFLGLCKPYKNVDGLIAEFRKIQDDAVLLVVGKFADPAYQRRCVSLAEGDRRIVITPGYVADEDLQVYLNATDVFVAPYREILTSGSAVLAASFGLPLVSIDKGFLLDFVTPEMGVLYSAQSERGLRDALCDALKRTWNRDAILAQARTHRFEDAAAAFVAAFDLDHSQPSPH